MHVSTFSARFCRLAAHSGQFWTPCVSGAGYNRSASSSQRSSSRMPSATVGVAISNSKVTKGANSTFSMATIPDRRLGALIVTRTGFFGSPALKSTSRWRLFFCVSTPGSLAICQQGPPTSPLQLQRARARPRRQPPSRGCKLLNARAGDLERKQCRESGLAFRRVRVKLFAMKQRFQNRATLSLSVTFICRCA